MIRGGIKEEIGDAAYLCSAAYAVLLLYVVHNAKRWYLLRRLGFL